MTMSDSFHSCSCAGLNENCYRCGGTGIAGVTPGKPGPLTEGRSQPSTADQKSGRSASKIDSIYCSKCKVSFNRLYWKKHKKKHQQVANRPPKQQPHAPHGCAQIGEPSPRSHSRWRSRTATKLLRKHPKLDSRHSSQRNRIFPSAVDERLAAIQNDRKERLLDHSKDIGFPCREGGRYGSYPAHDGFDDESKP